MYSPQTTVPPRANPNRIPFVTVFFFGSGFSALIYELVWFQLLRLTIGSSHVSVTILLIGFLGGMALGSWMFHRLVPDRFNSLAAYGAIELAIGVFGVVVLLTLPYISNIYLVVSGYGAPSIVVRAIFSLTVLLPPTMLIGATLPAIARWLPVDRHRSANVTRLYAANTIGAVLGTVVAGFYLLKNSDVYVASAVAVAVNVLIGLTSLMIARSEKQGFAYSPVQLRVQRQRIAWPIAAVATLCGFTSLGAQVIWTRLLSVTLGSTTYSFTIILAVFLAGLGFGSATASRAIRRHVNAPLALCICLALLMPAIGLAGFIIVSADFYTWLPSQMFEAVDRWLSDALRTTVAILPATFLWGASFPLCIASVGLRKGDPARPTGALLALNTLGAVVAIVFFNLIFVPLAGTKISQQLLIGLVGVSAGILWFRIILPGRFLSSGIDKLAISATMLGKFAVATTIFVVVGAFASLVRHPEPGLYAYGREVGKWTGDYEYVFSAEGVTSSVAVSEHSGTRYRSLHIGGKVVASTMPADMRLQRMLGHFPMLVQPKAKNVLVIGLGAGITAGTFALHDSVERIVIVEIEPMVAKAADSFFNAQNYDVLRDPRTSIVFDDARHFLATTDETFDIITADPIHPWVKGSGSLYTKEFLSLCRERLSGGGLITQWAPLYETNQDAVKSQVGTFLEVFLDGTIWNSQPGTDGYDAILMAGRSQLKISRQKIAEALVSSISANESLSEVGIEDSMDLLKAFAGDRDDLTQWLADFEVNQDKNLRLEYLAGRSIDNRSANTVFKSMTAGVNYPSGLFDVSPTDEAELRTWFRNFEVPE